MQPKFFNNSFVILLFILLAGLPGTVNSETKIDLKDTSIYGDQEKPVVEFDLEWKETDIEKVEPQALPDLFNEYLKTIAKRILDNEVNAADSLMGLKGSK